MFSCLDSNIQQVGHDDWEWITDEGNIKPRWATIPQASKACQELKKNVAQDVNA